MNTFYNLTLGEFNFTSLMDNQMDVDMNVEFPQVDPDELELAMKKVGYAQSIINLGFNCLLLRYDRQNILIDAGSGKDHLSNSLKALGINSDEIDIIIITHSDFDHIGGLEQFPNAQIIFPKQAFELWSDEKSRNEMIENYKSVFSKFLQLELVIKGAAYRELYGSTLLPKLKHKITLVEEEEEFIPGIRMIYAPGHRSDHYAVEFSKSDQTLLHIADSFRHAVQVEQPKWYSRVDSYPEQMEKSLKMLIKRAISKNAVLFGSHFTFPGFGKIIDGKLKMITP